MTLSGTYGLGENISGGGAAFNGNAPLGTLTGVLDGQYCALAGGANCSATGMTMTISDGTTKLAGLFSLINGGIVRNLKLGMTVNDTYSGGTATLIGVGSLAAEMTGGTIANVTTTSTDTVTSTITSPDFSADNTYVGGLVGEALSSGSAINIIGSSSLENVLYDYKGANSSTSDTAYVGGLVGYLRVTTANTNFSNSWAGGNVTALYDTGAAGNVTHGVGGLVGYLQSGQTTSGAILSSYATGNVSDSLKGNAYVGGLVGEDNSAVTATSAIADSYATGAVTYTGASTPDLGGLVGYNLKGTVATSYATGYVQSVGNYGGLVGVNGASGTVNNTAYWDSGTTGQTTSAGSANGNGVSTATLQGALQAGWSGTTWSIVAGASYPYLAWEVASGTPQVVSGIAYSDHGTTPIADGAVSGLINGSALTSLQTGIGSTTTGANGYYYYLLAPGTISGGGSDVLTYLTGATKGETFSDNATTSLSNLSIYGNYLKINSSGSTLSGMTADLATALGGNSGANFPFTLTGGALAMTSGVNLELDPTAASTSLDKTLTVSGAGLLLINDANAVTQTAAITTPNLLLLGSTGAYTLTNTGNNIATIAANTGSVNLDDTSTSGLTVGAISGTTGITTTGNTTLVSLGGSGSLTLTNGDGITAGGGNSIVLSDATTFTNSDGSGALTPGGGGSFLVWSVNPGNDNRGSLAYNFKQYNAAYGVTSVAGTGNGFLYTYAPTITATLTGTVNKTYDATTAATITGGGYSGASAMTDGDTLGTIGNLTSGTYDTKDAGTSKTVTVSAPTITASNGAATVYGYQISVSGNIGTITAKTISESGLSVAGNKTYDATTSATIIGAASLLAAEAPGSSTSDDKPYTGDTVSITGTTTGTYNSKDVASASSVTFAGLSLTGAQAGDYTLAIQTPASATITPKTISESGLSGPGKQNL